MLLHLSRSCGSANSAAISRKLLDADVRREFGNAMDRLRGGWSDRSDDVRLARSGDIGKTYVNVALTEAFAYHARTLDESRRQLFTRSASAIGSMEEMSLPTPTSRPSVMRGTLRDEVDAALMHCDALVLPTWRFQLRQIGADTVEIDGVEQMVRPIMLRGSRSCSILRAIPRFHCHAEIHVRGLPCGLQLVGRRQATVDLLRAALSCEPYVTPPAL